MKLDIRLESGDPIIFFPDEVDHGKLIICYTWEDEHSTACLHAQSTWAGNRYRTSQSLGLTGALFGSGANCLTTVTQTIKVSRFS